MKETRTKFIGSIAACLGFCYKLVAEEFTYEEATKECATYDKGVIGYPDQQADMEFFMAVGLGQKFWLGVTNNEEGGSWIDSDGKFYNGFVLTNTFDSFNKIEPEFMVDNF